MISGTNRQTMILRTNPKTVILIDRRAARRRRIDSVILESVILESVILESVILESVILESVILESPSDSCIATRVSRGRIQ